MQWTLFYDLHSGGGSKEPQQIILIEAPEKEACLIFFNRFGHSPHRVSCTCCGNDYSVSEHPSFEDAQEYHKEEQRRLLIPATEIQPHERQGEIPEQGYVWVD